MHWRAALRHPAVAEYGIAKGRRFGAGPSDDFSVSWQA
jgi:hypothetical protein